MKSDITVATLKNVFAGSTQTAEISELERASADVMSCSRHPMSSMYELLAAAQNIVPDAMASAIVKLA